MKKLYKKKVNTDLEITNERKIRYINFLLWFYNY